MERIRAAGYTRVSLLEQAREGVSLENKARKIELYCEMNDLALVELVTDPGICNYLLNIPMHARNRLGL